MKILNTETTEYFKRMLGVAIDTENLLSETDLAKVETLLTKLDTADRITAVEENLVDKVLGTINFCVLADGRLNIGTKSSSDKALAKALLDEQSIVYEEDEVSFYLSPEYASSFDTIVLQLAKIIK